MDLGQIKAVRISEDKYFNDLFWDSYKNYFLDPSYDNLKLIQDFLYSQYFIQWSILPEKQRKITSEGRGTPNFNTLTASEQ